MSETELRNMDPEFTQIATNFLYGEVYKHGQLSPQLRELIALVVMAAIQTPEDLKEHVEAGIALDMSVEIMKEAVYQCAPYIGIPRTKQALRAMNQVLQKEHMELVPVSQRTVSEDKRLEEGLKAQMEIFGDIIPKMQAATPAEQKHIQQYLSEYCFGDFYTRSGLNLKTRELLTFCILAALGGCESQVRSHIMGNVAMGNGKEVLIEALTQCMPYIGFPRTLNALACINEMLPEEKG